MKIPIILTILKRKKNVTYSKVKYICDEDINTIEDLLEYNSIKKNKNSNQLFKKMLSIKFTKSNIKYNFYSNIENIKIKSKMSNKKFKVKYISHKDFRDVNCSIKKVTIIKNIMYKIVFKENSKWRTKANRKNFIKLMKLKSTYVKMKGKKLLKRKVNRYLLKHMKSIRIEKINNIKMKLILVKLIAGSQSLRKRANRNIKSKNGNTSDLKIFSWNKSDRNIENKMEAIKNIINKHNPSILFVQELNFNIYQCQSIVNIPKYKFEVDNLLESNQRARIGCWVKRDLVYDRIKTIEDDRNPVIALNIGFQNKKE